MDNGRWIDPKEVKELKRENEVLKTKLKKLGKIEMAITLKPAFLVDLICYREMELGRGSGKQ